MRLNLFTDPNRGPTATFDDVGQQFVWPRLLCIIRDRMVQMLQLFIPNPPQLSDEFLHFDAEPFALRLQPICPRQ